VRNIIYWLTTGGTALLILMSTTWRKISALPAEPILTRALLIGIVPSLVIWVGLASAFATVVYPNIDREFGSGRSVQFELTMAPENQTLPNGTYDVLAVTDRYWVLRDVTADTYFLLSSDQVRIARLKRPGRPLR
jgi:hypothetical protein